MEKFQEATKIMNERFGKDSIIAMATTDSEGIHNRMIDAFYFEGSFYSITNAKSNKMAQIEHNPNVAVCAVDWFTGKGTAENIGWVLDPKNAEIRTMLREAFKGWYDVVNNENNPDSCYLRIKLESGLLIKDHGEWRYLIDFTNNTALKSENYEEFK